MTVLAVVPCRCVNIFGIVVVVRVDFAMGPMSVFLYAYWRTRQQGV